MLRWMRDYNSSLSPKAPPALECSSRSSPLKGRCSSHAASIGTSTQVRGKNAHSAPCSPPHSLPECTPYACFTVVTILQSIFTTCVIHVKSIHVVSCISRDQTENVAYVKLGPRGSSRERNTFTSSIQ